MCSRSPYLQLRLQPGAEERGRGRLHHCLSDSSIQIRIQTWNFKYCLGIKDLKCHLL